MIILMTFKDVRLWDHIVHLWVVYASPQKFGYVFSEDVDVVRLVSRVMPYVASFQVRILYCV